VVGAIVAVADLDQDGDADVIAEGGGFLRWFENSGTQTYVSRTVDASFGTAATVRAVDLDQDGDVDLLAAAGSLIAWYENNGQQTFTERTINGSAPTARSAVAVDMEGDGDLDVLAASAGDQTLAWYENNGQQTFTAHAISTEAANIRSADAADMDGDGDVDVVAGFTSGGAVAWYENDGALSFTYRAIDAASWSVSATAAADLDGDGDLDVAASGSRVAWYENDGAETFTPRLTATSTGIHASIAAVDVDRDGRFDLVTGGTGAAPIAWFRQIAQFDYGDAPSPYKGVHLQDNGARHVAVGPTLGTLRDAESDGLRTSTAGVGEGEDDGVAFGEVRLGQSAGTVVVTVQHAASGAKLDAWIDFDGDGSWGGAGEHIFASLPMGEGANHLAFAIPGGAVAGATYARFRISTAGGLGVNGAAPDGEVEDHPLTLIPRDPATGLFGQPNPIAGGAAFMVTADVDGDGDMDVVTTGFAWHENLGGGGFVTHAVPAAGVSSEDIAAADLDSDGDVDFVAFGDGQLIWMENDGQQNFTQRNGTPGSSFRGFTAVAIADMDGDGDCDVLATDLSGPSSVHILVNNGSQQFTPRPVAVFGRFATSVVAADMDRDGDLDVVAGGLGLPGVSEDVVWLQNDGAMTFARRTVKVATSAAIPGGATEAVAVGDMDGDGDLDVVAAGVSQFPSSSPTATLSWHEHLESGEFVSHTIDVGRNLRWATLADFDVDGDLDVVASGFTSSIDLYENVGATQFIRRQIAPGEGAGYSTAAADMDGDGDLDVVALGVAGAAGLAWFENFNLDEPDYGDAPAPYPTTRADDGPVHSGGGPRLGATRDAEADGAPTPAADGDFDDGVALTPIRVGQSLATVTVHVQNAPQGARVDAWIDFNGDGNWGGAGEQVFASVDVTDGDNVLAFGIPTGVVAGTAVARFRLSTAGGLRYGGAALDGEVEDYLLTIDPPAPATGEFGPAGSFADYAGLVRAADIDGDGDPDLMFRGDNFPQVGWLENLGDGAFLVHSNGFTGTPLVLGLRPVDLDRDGDMDFVATVSNGVAWFENDGDESFNFHAPAGGAVISGLRAVFDVADLDGDGDLDVIASRQVSVMQQIAVLLNDGQQRFTTALPVTTPTMTPQAIRAADVDRDGDMDFAASFGADGITGAQIWFENDGLSFTQHVLAPGTPPVPSVSGRDIAPVDFDGDGDVDFVTLSYANGLAVDWFENDGNQSFTKRAIDSRFTTTSSMTPTGADRLVVADVDGDADLDVAVADNRGYWLFRNQGAGQFIATQLLANFTAFWTPLAAADFDGDGVLEFVGSTWPSFGLFRFDDLPLGDYDRNGTVDEADRQLYEQTLGQPAVPPGAGADGDRSGVIDPPDLAVWEANVGRGPAPRVAAADIQQNEQIDGHDFLLWQRRVGNTFPVPGGPPGSGDVDFSGVVDAGDLAVWQRQFGQGVTPDFDWINLPNVAQNAEPAAAFSARPEIRPGALLSLETPPTALRVPSAVRRPPFRPTLATAARDAALSDFIFAPAAAGARALVLASAESGQKELASLKLVERTFADIL
jgi:hypothetical protein